MSATAQLRIETTDHAGMQRFYVALGGVEQSRTERTVTLQLSGLAIVLARSDTQNSAHPANTDDRFELVVPVSDATSTLAALLDAGGRQGSDEAARTDLVVRDPDGHRIRLTATSGTAVSGSGMQRTATRPAVAADATPPTAPPAAAVGAGEALAPDPAAASDPASRPDRPALMDLEFPQSSLPAGYYTEDGVPTFDAVADRITQRSAAADGNAVLDGESARGAADADGMEKLKKAGKDRLDQLRKSMGL